MPLRMFVTWDHVTSMNSNCPFEGKEGEGGFQGTKEEVQKYKTIEKGFIQKRRQFMKQDIFLDIYENIAQHLLSVHPFRYR